MTIVIRFVKLFGVVCLLFVIGLTLNLLGGVW